MDKVVPSLVTLLKTQARPNSFEYFLLMALLVSTRGTCARRRCGCVLVDNQNKVLSTGYNGVAAGLPHCVDHACPGAGLPSGTGLNLCEALHAEENALIQCTRPNDIAVVYCTTSPCIHCIRRLLNTGARDIVFAELYPHPESEKIWTSSVSNISGARTWNHIPWDTLSCIGGTPVATLGHGRSS